MQSLIVIACKIIRIIYIILKKGVRYDSEKMMKDIRLPGTDQEPAAQWVKKSIPHFQNPAGYLDRRPETGQGSGTKTL